MIKVCPWRLSPKDPLKLLLVKSELAKGSLPQPSDGLGWAGFSAILQHEAVGQPVEGM